MEGEAPLWHLPASAVQLQPAFDYSALLYATSCGVWLPREAPGDSPDTLGTFDAVDLQRAPGGDGKQHLLDALCYTGGMVWKLEWLPQAEARAEAQAMEYFMAAVHPKGWEHNRANQARSGPACLQLWAVPASCGQPACAYTLLHQGGVTWDLKWLPLPTRSAAGQRRRQGAGDYGVLGVLATVLADGAVCVTGGLPPPPPCDGAHPPPGGCRPGRRGPRLAWPGLARLAGTQRAAAAPARPAVPTGAGQLAGSSSCPPDNPQPPPPAPRPPPPSLPRSVPRA
jgi:hypothetical protein